MAAICKAVSGSNVSIDVSIKPRDATVVQMAQLALQLSTTEKPESVQKIVQKGP